ncbi:Crp/Fnr family transcriptional regulator [Spirochaetia bacterium]|nr:Crp/Fnr family transcriptional regulator [Spirochaetia bacterium]
MDIDLSAFSRFARTFQPGEIIFSEFEPGDTFFIIQSGRVELLKMVGDIENTVDILHPLEIFGEMAILENSPRSATAIAMDAVTILEFNRQNFEILMLGNPPMALKLLKMFTRRIYDAKRRFMIMALPDPQAKVADVFLMLDETQDDLDRSADSREFKTTVDIIARWAGMDPSQTREALGVFAGQRRVEIYADKIVVNNINDFRWFVNSRRVK